MKILLTITVLIVTSSLLQGQEVCEKNDPKKHPTLTNKTYVDKITGRPINFYLNHRDIDSPAKLFLYDDEETFGFLDSVLTKNAETRPFTKMKKSFWQLNLKDFGWLEQTEELTYFQPVEATWL